MTTENAQPVMLLEDPADVGLTGPGNEVVTFAAAAVHFVVDVGHTPLTVAATCAEPGVIEVVAQFTYAVVWVKSVT